jgi:hypothetical protein
MSLTIDPSHMTAGWSVAWERIGAAIGRTAEELAELSPAELADRVEQLRSDRDRCARERDGAVAHASSRSLGALHERVSALLLERDEHAARAAMLERQLNAAARRIAELADAATQPSGARDAMAAAALTGLLARTGSLDGEHVAREAYRAADAMMAERSRK